MQIAMFSVKPYDQSFFAKHAPKDLHIRYFEAALRPETALLAKDMDAVCIFVNDVANRDVLNTLKQINVHHIALRCAGYNNVDLDAASELGITVSRVPAYSPEAVAEHTLALIMALNRKLHKAYNRVKEDNFSLVGLLGFNLFGKTAGIIGTGKIGETVSKLLLGLGMKVVCYDPYENQNLLDAGARYVPLDDLFEHSDVISLHCPLMPETHHIINQSAIEKMKPGVMLINTSRGGLVDTKAIIAGLKQEKIGHLGLDVYEMESDIFFRDLSAEIVQDDVFQRLLTFPNVLITGHQGFFTEEALSEIAMTTCDNLLKAPSGGINPQNLLT